MSKKIKTGHKISLLMMTALINSTVGLQDAYAENDESALTAPQQDSSTSKENDFKIKKTGESESLPTLKSKVTPEVEAEIKANKQRVADLEKRSDIDTFANPRKEANLEQARKNSRDGISHEKSKEGATEAVDTEHRKEEKTDKKNKARLGQDDESPLKKSTVNEAQRDENQARLKSRNGLFLSKDEDKAIENKARQNAFNEIENEPEKLEAARAKTNKMNAELEAKKASTAEKSETVTKKPSKLTNLKNKIKDKLSGKKSVDVDAKAKEAADLKSRRAQIDNLHAYGERQRKDNINKQALSDNKEMMQAEADAKKAGIVEKSETAAPKKQGFFSKLFGKSKPKPNVPANTEQTVTKGSSIGEEASTVLREFEGHL